MKKYNKTFDYSTKRWGIKPINNILTDFQGLELVLFDKHIPSSIKNKSIKVLDLGCGGGNIDFYLKDKYPKWNITGIDISKESIKIAKSSFPGINFVSSSSQKLKFNGKSFNLVVSFDTIEHFEELDKVLTEVKRVLKNKGLLYIAVPLEKQFPTIYWVMYKLGWRGKKEFAGHVNFFNNKELIKYLEKFNFKLLKMNYSNHLIFSFFDIPYYLMQSFMGKQAVSFESKIYESKNNLLYLFFSFFKKLVSFITFIESYLFRSIPGGKGHYLFYLNGK